MNPAEGPDIVSVYVDDVLVFSKTLQDHHLTQVLMRLKSVGLKLKLSKCHFACKELTFLGHVITPTGVKPNDGLIAAVRDFPEPGNIKELRRFLGLVSYQASSTLHNLTKKDVEFSWSASCKESFEHLKYKTHFCPLVQSF